MKSVKIIALVLSIAIAMSLLVATGEAADTCKEEGKSCSFDDDCCQAEGLNCALTRADLNLRSCEKCIGEGQTCGLLHRCCDGSKCSGPFFVRLFSGTCEFL